MDYARSSKKLQNQCKILYTNLVARTKLYNDLKAKNVKTLAISEKLRKLRPINTDIVRTTRGPAQAC
ncbi:hypothetical protein PG984_014236 [Apiospora sp. TS-2023a]